MPPLRGPLVRRHASCTCDRLRGHHFPPQPRAPARGACPTYTGQLSLFYPLTPLCLTRSTIKRCRNKKTRSRGRIPIAAPINSSCRLIVCAVRNVESTICTVHEL